MKPEPRTREQAGFAPAFPFEITKACAGKVVWITPTAAQGNRTAGIGIQFAESADGETARTKIESILAGILGSEKATQTM